MATRERAQGVVVKTIAIIQARIGSTRLPGKVMEDLAGEPMLVRTVNRAKRAQTLDEVVVATTTNAGDDVIAELCDQNGWPCSRGSEDDVLDRYYNAAVAHKAEVVVRITSDCPLIEPPIVDQAIELFRNHQLGIDYVSTSIPKRTFPRGLDTEVIRFDALKRAWNEDDNPATREHVTPYIYKNPQWFKLLGIGSETNYSYMRWTVDTQEDLEFVREIYNHFGHDRFSWQEVLEVLRIHPEWMEINRHVKQKEI